MVTDLRPRMSPTFLGGALGACNTFVIAVGITSFEHRNAEGVMWIMSLGAIPGVVLGCILGAIAGSLGTLAMWQRLLCLIPPAFGLVALLADWFELSHYLWIACIPTLAGVMLLERRTRADSAMPMAIAR